MAKKGRHLGSFQGVDLFEGEDLGTRIADIKKGSTKTLSGFKKDTVDTDGGLANLQDVISKSLLQNIPEAPDEKSIMEKFAERRKLSDISSSSQRGLIRSEAGEAIEDVERMGDRTAISTLESRRGFATNTVALKNLATDVKSDVRDLERTREQLILQEDFLNAGRIDSLIVQEMEALSNARVNFMNELFAFSGEIRAQRGFETPEQTRNRNAFVQLSSQFANVPGISDANNFEELVGLIGPEMQKDVNLRRQVQEAQIRASNAAATASAASSGGRDLPASQTVMLSDAKFIPSVLDDLDDLINENENLFGFFSGRRIGSEDKAIVEAELKIAAQLVGKFMEGGVLRKEDEIKYAKMLPKLTDLNPTVARAKLQAVRDMLGLKYNAYVQDFAGSGFDVSGFDEIDFGVPDVDKGFYVKEKSTGLFGYIPRDEFDKSLYVIVAQ